MHPAAVPPRPCKGSQQATHPVAPPDAPAAPVGPITVPAFINVVSERTSIRFPPVTYALTISTPETPVAPTAPVAPVAPVAPTAPVAPVAPTTVPASTLEVRPVE